MSTKAKLLSIAALATASLSVYAADHPKTGYGFGSTPSAEELNQFTSPLPDGRGLPPGKGTVSAGKTLYENQCLACHGQKLEGGMGDKLIGGRGSLVNNDPTKKPVKTVESYWPYATTLFDYIKRAMPLLQPGSLSNDEVYALSAYILAEGKIIPQDATLDAASLAKIKMPNRDGFIPDPRPDKFRAAK